MLETAPAPSFASYRPSAPDEAALTQSYRSILAELDEDGADAAGLALRWNALRTQVRSWSAQVHIRRVQDTRDPEQRKQQELADELRATVQQLDVEVKTRLLARAEDPGLAELLGTQTLDLWSADCAAFHPAIREDIVSEQKIGHRYTDLMAEAQVEFRGELLPLPRLRKPCSAPDRAEREEAHRALWTWFDGQRDTLDSIFDELVTLRASMASKVGARDFVELGYRRMQRVDYDREDVECFRDEVRRVVVPLVSELRREQGRKLGVDPLMAWDEPVSSPEGSPEPVGGIDGLADAGIEAFDAVHPEIGSFYKKLLAGGFLDLGSRPGKAGGGFCSFLPELKTPFVFSHSGGTWADVKTLVHEVGHAFQGWTCRDMEWGEQRHATYESCEIHSMSLEFLAWPQYEAFFGERAQTVRRKHLVESLAFLPYGVAVDHFQHLVYENPGASPAERHAMWLELEQKYLPWRNWGDIPHASIGGRWQYQRHIYLRPFYYIDYTLALSCALQFWARSLTDREGAMTDYVALCRLGGTRPFQGLCDAIGLRSPLRPGCLDRVVASAQDWLEQA